MTFDKSTIDISVTGCTFTRSSKGTTNGSSVKMAKFLSSDTDSCGGSSPTAQQKQTHQTCFFRESIQVSDASLTSKKRKKQGQVMISS